MFVSRGTTAPVGRRKGPLAVKKSYAIANQKGGVGKTTTAVNLSAALALGGHRCLLIDLDPQGNATSGLGAEKRERGGAEAALVAPEAPDTWVEKTRVENLSLVPSTHRLGGVELLLRHEVNRYQRLKQALEHVAEKFDYVLIDCPPSTGLLPMNALIAAHEVIIPVQCEYYAMEGLAQMIGTLAAAETEHAAGVQIGGFLLTMYDPEVTLAGEIANEVISHFRDRTYATVVPRDPVLSEAPSHGLSVIEYSPRSRGANAYIQLAKEIVHANR